MSLKLRRKIWAHNTVLGIMKLSMVTKAIGTGEATEGQREEEQPVRAIALKNTSILSHRIQTVKKVRLIVVA